VFAPVRSYTPGAPVLKCTDLRYGYGFSPLCAQEIETVTVSIG
jgi:hypothetical protein